MSRFWNQCIKIAGWVANSIDPDQMLHSAASDLGLHCLHSLSVYTFRETVFLKKKKNRNILPWYFQWVPTTYVFCRNKKMSQSMTKLTIRLVRRVNTNQPAHPHSLTKVFANRMCLLQPLGYPKRDKGEPLPNWLGVLADLSLCWSHRFYCRLCRALAQMIQCSLYNSHPRKQGPVVQTNDVVS